MSVISPNWFAYVALFSWPLVTFVIYQRMPIVRATLWSILGAYLMLPVGLAVDLPMLPPLDKSTIPNMSAFIACSLIKGKSAPLLPKFRMARWLVLLYVISPFITVLNNPDPIVSGQLFIKGMEYYDALSAVIRQLLFILPFLLGLAFFRSAQDFEELLMILAFAGLLYSLPMFLEIRMSPQLHTWIYGYFPHSFLQQMREGGFRPVVFLGHGLNVAFFIMTSAIAATALWRIRRRVGLFSGGQATAYLMLLLFLCKSMASFLYGVVLYPFVRFGKPRHQIRLATVMVIFALIYPLIRGGDLFPSELIHDWAASISVERAESFDYRIRNEDLLLKKANERPLFGWGSWGRGRIYDSSGRDKSVTEGRWIIVIGQFGWVGLLAEFGLLALPVVRCIRALPNITNQREAIVFAAVSLILSINEFDLLPNNTMSPWTWLIAGALLGRSEQLIASKISNRG